MMASTPTRQRIDPRRLERKCETQKVGFRAYAEALTAAEGSMAAGRVNPGCHITPYRCRCCGEWHNANKVIVPPGTVRINGVYYRAGRRLWTAADDRTLRTRYPDRPTPEIARVLQRSLNATYARADILGLKKSAAYLASPAACRLRRSEHVGRRYWIPKGHVPANKGLRRPGWHAGRMKQTQFQKNQAPRNWHPIGHERLVDGYRYRKVTDIRHVPWTRNWKPVHVILWEEQHGPLPPGHALVFQNGDRTDIRLDNLELITRRALMARNTVHNLPAPLKGAIHLLGQLNRRIRERTTDGPPN